MKLSFSLLFLLFCAIVCYGQKYVTKHHIDPNGYSYETVANDPTGMRLYTLKNGLKVYLAQCYDEPRISTVIAVKAGSNYDPKDNTGLAHYLEHLLFNGNDKIGTLDWSKEEPLLKEITKLFEDHKSEKDPKKKKAIYHTIDSISLEASRYGIPDEYRTLATSIGANFVNGITYEDRTVYVSLIPSTALEKFLILEKTRFQKLTPRAFHTELETVYEEFNKGQDQVYRQKLYALIPQLFKNHPYGLRRPIGESEHLKNPSIAAIQEYFNTYYIPNNMAIILVGTLEFDHTIKLVDDTFGKFKNKPLQPIIFPKEEIINTPQEVEISGPDEESVMIGFRNAGIHSEDAKYLTLINEILYNNTAGLFDTELVLKQKLKNAVSQIEFASDYGVQYLDGYSKAGQSLEEVRDLMLSQIDKIKKGDFGDWLIEASINNLKKKEKITLAKSFDLDNPIFYSFIHSQEWSKRLSFIDEIEKISKNDLINFANRFYQKNYAVVYKRKGESKDIVKVQKPTITPISMNTSSKSLFSKEFDKIKTQSTKPQFVDYGKEIKKLKLKNNVKIEHVKNTKSDLFEMDIIFDIGRNDNKIIPIAFDYLNFIGTDKYSSEEIKREYYKLGLTFRTNVQANQTILHLEGIQENLNKGVELLNHTLSNVIADELIWANLVKRILKGREDNLTNKNNILNQGLLNYALYGSESPLRNIYRSEELVNIKPIAITNFIKSLRNYEHRIFYYGNDLGETIALLNESYSANAISKFALPVIYPKQKTNPIIYFVDFDMVQADVAIITTGEKLDKKTMLESNLFSNYFNKVLNRQIREERSLAYSTFGNYWMAPDSISRSHFYMYAGTQANKIAETVKVMTEMMHNLPEIEAEFINVKEDILKSYEAERIPEARIFWSYENLKRQGITYDIRKEIYPAVKKMTLKDMKEFFNKNIGGRDFAILIVGNKKDLNMEELSTYGEIKEMDVHYLFNY